MSKQIKSRNVYFLLKTRLSLIWAWAYEKTHPNRTDVHCFNKGIHIMTFVGQVRREVAKSYRLRIVDKNNVVIINPGFIGLHSIKTKMPIKDRRMVTREIKVGLA